MKKMGMGGMAPSKMGKVKTAAPSRDGVATKGKTRGKIIKMAEGGMPKTKKPMSGGLPPLEDEPKGRRPGEGMLQEKLRKIVPPARKSGMAKGGMTKMRYGGKC